MMVRRGIFLLLLMLLALSLAGCFRQASEPLDTVDEPLSASLDASAGNGQELITPTIPALTAFPSTSLPLATNTEPSGFPLDATSTNDFGNSVNTVPVVPLGSNTPTVITPGAPSGPVTIPNLPTSTPDPLATLPAGSGLPLITPTDPFGASSQPNECLYTVQTGDNLYRIAVNHDTTVDELRAANPELQGEVIYPGDQLSLPNCTPGGTSTTVQPSTDQQGSTGAVPIGGTGAGEPQTHIVERGETLGSIARLYGVTIQAIVDANNLPNPDRISEGQELVIP